MSYPEELIISTDGGKTNQTYSKKAATTTPPPPGPTVPPPPPPPPPPVSTTESKDKNGILYVQPLLKDGYKLQYSKESWDFRKNFRSDGSQRCDFGGNPRRSAYVGGYFKVEGNDDNEEIAAKLNGGPHSSNNPEYADVIDVGLINFKGTRSRVRWEKTHPQYSSGVSPTYSELPIGDVRNKWVGACGLKINIDSNNDGRIDQVAVVGLNDVGGLDANGRPKNEWKVTYKRFFKVEEIPLKSVEMAYVEKIGKPELCQQTIRIDQQPLSKWNSTSDPPYRYVTCKEVKAVRV